MGDGSRGRGKGREGHTEKIYNKHEEQMKMSCSQLATPLTPVQALSRTNGNARVCHALVVAFGRGTKEREGRKGEWKRERNRLERWLAACC